MIESAIEIKRTIEPTSTNAEIEQIKKWFKTEYMEKLATANRDKYLGLPVRVSRYALEMEAYEKENRLRELMGEDLLPEPKFSSII
jgi:hypothetical protein